MRHDNYHFKKGLIVSVPPCFAQLTDQFWVTDVEFLQVGQRRIPCAEIIQRHLNASFAQYQKSLFNAHLRINRKHLGG